MSRDATPTLTHFTDFSTVEYSELKNCIDNQETQSLNSFRLCPVYDDDFNPQYFPRRGGGVAGVATLFPVACSVAAAFTPLRDMAFELNCVVIIHEFHDLRCVCQR